ncbi:Thiamine pyrophosphate enzyme domain protein TPP-binding [Paracholeplasma brassicae]|uniref:Thiamine pyrophosphate enzyme domain protein TPP-binding n=1 Tax=Acholeplasma brassicae TaxID=61635 RepID=U4KNJ1_9MOLU|nr:thiamine pyrophosphate-dependent enzyme [Paracholeplasma brassicae]CCV65845.1 Thiamine pyrophosphate enzyme domain protein TPP-binding [Paracholeplasma brassicae]
MIKYEKTSGLTESKTHYCPGCTHGILHKLVAEVLEELEVLDHTVGVASVGCSVYAYDYFNCDMQQAAHGRACAVATGIKRVLNDRVVFTYQGDGDLASIGIAETIHAANRGENITVIFANNATYGMTGGQMAPTTLNGQVTTTSKTGRNPQTQGYPIKVTEMLQHLDGVAYLERVSLTSAANAKKVKKAIKKAFEMQINQKGFSMIEVLSTCPVNWKMSPIEAMHWVDDEMSKVYPLGVFKDVSQDE